MGDWDAQKMLDLYIHDYMVRSNMHRTAEAFAQETGVSPDSVGVTPSEGFLNDWWSIFWDVYSATSRHHSEASGPSSSMAAQTAENMQPIEITTLPDLGLNNMVQEARPPLPSPPLPNLQQGQGRNQVEQVPTQGFQGFPLTLQKQLATDRAQLQPDSTPTLAARTFGKLDVSASGSSKNTGNPIFIDDHGSTKGKNVIVEEPLNLDDYFNHDPTDLSPLLSFPAHDETEQRGKETLKRAPSQGLPSSTLQQVACDGVQLQRDLSAQTLGKPDFLASGNSNSAGNHILIDESLSRGKNAVVEEPLNVDDYLNDDPFDLSPLLSFPAKNETEQRGRKKLKLSVPSQELPSTQLGTDIVQCQLVSTTNLAVQALEKPDLASGSSKNAGNPVLNDDGLNREKNIVEEEPLDVSDYLNDGSTDLSPLQPFPGYNQTEQEGKQVPSQGLPLTQQIATNRAQHHQGSAPDLEIQTLGELYFSASGSSKNASNPIFTDDGLTSGMRMMVEKPSNVVKCLDDSSLDVSLLPPSVAQKRSEQKGREKFEKIARQGRPLTIATDAVEIQQDPKPDLTAQTSRKTSMSASDDSPLPPSLARKKNEHQKGFSFEEVGSLHTSTKFRCCHFSSSGKLLASAGQDRKVLIWNLESSSKNAIESHSDTITDIRFKPNSSIIVTSSFDRTLLVRDVLKPTKSNSRLAGHVLPVMSVDFHPTKVDVIGSCDSNNEIRLWNVKDSSCVRAFKGASTQVRFQPHYGEILAAATGNVINMIDVETGKIQYQLEGHAKDVQSMCWDKSGKFMASVSEDCVRIWSIMTGRDCVHKLHSGENKFTSCTFHPRYCLVMAIGSHKTLEIWNPLDGKKLWIENDAHKTFISALTNTSATNKIASVSEDSFVKVWK